MVLPLSNLIPFDVIGAIVVAGALFLIVLHAAVWIGEATRDVVVWCVGSRWSIFPFRLGDSLPRELVRRPVALVTGGLSGIGFETSCKFLKLGYDIVVWDVARQSDGGAAAEASLRKHAVSPRQNVICWSVDVGCESATAVAAQTLLVDRGLVPDVLVLNAGIVNGRRIIDGGMDCAATKSLFRVNVLQLYYVTSAFILAMRTRPSPFGRDWHRSVVVIGSVAGFAGTAFMTDYNASKAAANCFAEALAAELSYDRMKGAIQVDVTLVCPYLVDSGMFKGTRRIGWLPPLTPEYVAESVITAVRRRKRLVVRPHFLIGWLAAKTLIPWTFVPYVDMILGGSAAMSTFTGHRSTRSKEE